MAGPPTITYPPPPKKKGLFKGLLTIGFPLINPKIKAVIFGGGHWETHDGETPP